MAFKDILAAIVADESDRSALAQFANKYPDLDKLPSPIEFAAKTSRLSEIETEAGTLRGKVAKWDDWAGTEWDEGAGKTHLQRAAEERLVTVNQELEALRARQAAGVDMTFDDVKANLTKDGYATKAELDKAYAAPGDVEKRLQQQGSAFEAIFTKLTPWMTEYRMEFGKPMDNAHEFVSFAVAKGDGIKNPRAVYEEFVTKERETAKFAKERADFEAQKTADMQKLQSERESLNALKGRAGQLTDTQGGVGHFQAKTQAMQNGTAGDVVAGDKIGDLTAARKGYQAWVRGDLKGTPAGSVQ